MYRSAVAHGQPGSPLACAAPCREPPAGGRFSFGARDACCVLCARSPNTMHEASLRRRQPGPVNPRANISDKLHAGSPRQAGMRIETRERMIVQNHWSWDVHAVCASTAPREAWQGTIRLSNWWCLGAGRHDSSEGLWVSCPSFHPCSAPQGFPALSPVPFWQVWAQLAQQGRPIVMGSLTWACGKGPRNCDWHEDCGLRHQLPALGQCANLTPSALRILGSCAVNPSYVMPYELGLYWIYVKVRLAAR
jgi:hypothetical protein